MKKIVLNTSLILFMLGTLALLIMNTMLVTDTVHHTVQLWATRVFPIQFPFFIVSMLLIHYGIAHFIGGLLRPLTITLFKTKSVSGFIFIMALLGGTPQNAVLINDLYAKKALTEQEAKQLLAFNVFVNPFFILGTIGFSYFNNLTIGLIILIAHVGANVVIGISLRHRLKHLTDQEKTLSPFQEMVQNQTNQPFGDVLTDTLQKGLNTMFLVGGFMILFSIVVVLLNESGIVAFIYQFITMKGVIPIDYEVFHACFIGLFEVVNFIDRITKTNVDLRFMISIIAAFISLGGFSIHTQIRSVLTDLKINYFSFLRFRLIQMMGAGLMAYLLFPYLYQEQTHETSHWLSISTQKNLVLMSIFILLVLLTTLILSQRKRPIQS